MTSLKTSIKLDEENFLHKVFRFRDREAGVSLIYDPSRQCYTYNAYCLETKLMKELYTVEHDFLEDAIDLINEEFGSWDLIDFSTDGGNTGCGSCVAK